MTVYVETNFVLEHALEQQQSKSCSDLLALARSGAIELAIPAFSLAEPHDALLAKEKARHKLSEDLKSHLNELGRSQQYRHVPGDFGALPGLILASGESEREGLRRTIHEICGSAHIIPLDSSIFESAPRFEKDLDLSAEDSLVFASIMKHLSETNPPESCFLNRNTKDFDNPSVREILDSRLCKFVGGFDEGLGFVRARLSGSS
jgi:hypothetical protein